MLGRTFTLGVVMVCWFAGSFAQALAADASFVERESRSQETVVVRPGSPNQPSETEDPADEISSLKRAIREEKRKRDILELKFNVLRERVRAEGIEVEKGNALGSKKTSSAKAAEELNDQLTPQAKGATNSRGVIREYTWTPPHREGDKVTEGHYQLRTKEISR